MSGACVALVASLLLGASGLRYDLGAVAQVGYSTDWETLAPFRSAQLELVPRLGLAYGERSLDLRLTYDPQILTDGSRPPSVLHRAILSLDLRASRELRLAALVSASYGTYTFRYQSVSLPAAPTGTPAPTPGSSGGPEPSTPPPPATPPPTTGPTPTVQAVPIVATARYVQANAGLGLTVRGSRDFGVSAALSYMMQGGADPVSRLTVPLERGPTTSVQMDWRLAPRDTLATILGGSYYTFLAGPSAAVGRDAWTSRLVEAWKHDLSRTGSLQLGLGVGTSGDATGFPHLAVNDVTPVAEAILDLGGGLRLSAGYGPFVDFISGISARRVDAYATMAIPLFASWGLVANASAAEITTGPQHDQITTAAQIVASARLMRTLRIFGGLTGLWQRAGPDFPAAEVRQIGVVVGADYLQAGRL